MPSIPPLLEPFYRESYGIVYYKGYPPQRGDDIPALTELLKVLPDTVRCVPLPADRPHVVDNRVLLANVLNVLGLADCETTSRPTASKEELLTLIGEATLDADNAKAASILEIIESNHSELRVVLSQLVTKISAEESKYVYPVVPDDCPILILGRQSSYLNPLIKPGDPRALPNVLAGAGFPNRFDFFAFEDERTDEGGGIRDRKTNLIWRRGAKKKNVQDVGYVFLNSTANYQTVIVAAGASSLGTYTAVQILTKRWRVLRKCMKQHKTARRNAKIDIAFRCRRPREIAQSELVLVQEPQNIATDLANNDLIGFSWEGSNRFDSLLKWWSDAADLGKSMTSGNRLTWHWNRPKSPEERREQSCVRVTIKAKAFVSGRHRLICGQRLTKVLEEVRQHLHVDLIAWSHRVFKFANAAEGDDTARPYETFRPILAIGETGTGKSILADCIADAWSGSTLEDVSALWGKKTDIPDYLLQQAQQALRERLAQWPRTELQPESQRLLTFSPVAVPETMLDKELFGQADDYVQGSAPAPGVFILAGTGVLFLDELLELKRQDQRRLLVVLQKGVVWPLGARTDYPFFCRLVAATNQAGNERELKRQIGAKKARRDLIARFNHKYELPPLRERTEDIIPVLIELIRKRALDDGLTTTDIQRVRISKPAFEALVTHNLEENVRNLQHLVNALPPKLIKSFADETVDSDRLSEQAITLKHLKSLREDFVDDLQEWVHKESGYETEKQFFEFVLDVKTEPFLDRAQIFGEIIEARIAAPDTADLISKLEKKFKQLPFAIFGLKGEHIADLASVRNELVALPATDDRFVELLKKNAVRKSLLALSRRLAQAFGTGDSRARITELVKDPNYIELASRFQFLTWEDLGDNEDARKRARDEAVKRLELNQKEAFQMLSFLVRQNVFNK